MSLATLCILYGMAGAGCALARLASRTAPQGRAADACLLLVLWPLYGPFMLLRVGSTPGIHGSIDAGEVAFLVALHKAGNTPLGGALPDPATARALAGRLRVAAAKVTEIDALLGRPEFSETEVKKRVDALRGRGASECAVATAAGRLQNIRRLRALRDRFANELDEIRELLMQLTTQAEVVRLAGAPSMTEPSTTELVRELVSRVEGLDQMLDDDPQLLDARG